MSHCGELVTETHESHQPSYKHHNQMLYLPGIIAIERSKSEQL